MEISVILESLQFKDRKHMQMCMKKIFQDMVARIGDILYGVYRGKIKLQKRRQPVYIVAGFNAQMGDLGTSLKMRVYV